MTEVAAESSDVPSDAALIGAVRRGDVAAYGLLYERHLGAARRAAGALVSTRAEREDLVAEAFTRVLRALRAGHGPNEEFRPYLLTTMRNAVISAGRRTPTALYAQLPDAWQVPGRDDPMGNRVHASVVADAFASLPQRWRTVLWHTEIEGESPAQLAPLLGLTPNGVAALAYRAREGLRQAYLGQYLPTIERGDCRGIVEQLAGWVRQSLSATRMRRITAHLNQCDTCRELATGLGKLNDELRATLAPVVLGAPFALAYLSASAGTSGSVLTAAANAGVSTFSWLTAAKTAVAGAAIVASTAVGTVASNPLPVPLPDGGDSTISVPGQRPPASGARGQARPTGSRPRPPALAAVPAPPSGVTGADATPAAQPSAQRPRPEAKEARKAAKKADKAEAKRDKKESKKQAKESKKHKEKDKKPK